MKMRHVLGLFFSILSLTFFVANGSAAKNKIPMGSWNADLTTKQSIESGKILPNHTYYYSGSVDGPDCFIAIDNQYTLRKSPVWAKVNTPEKAVHDWLQYFKTEGPRSSDLRGGVILTPDGKTAGIWYSHYAVNIVEMPEPGVLVVYQPHPPSGHHTGQTN